MEVKHTKDGDHIRGLFERALAYHLKLKPAKLLFKKYLDFETSQGNSKTQSYVKTKAQQFVEAYVKVHGGPEEDYEGQDQDNYDAGSEDDQ
jgi:hypothetical protein